jgi:23S rRNA pseudouridine1911/1915/1917 synthase
MKKDKAYKVLALQEGISNTKAKELIDRGLVYSSNKKVMIARGEIDVKTRFKVMKIDKIKPIFEDDDIVVVNKPAFLNSDEVERELKGTKLLHRLDRETSGVLMLTKNEEFRTKAIKEFQKDRVYKEYTAWVDGMVVDDYDIDKPILSEKRNNKAYSKILKAGKSARTEVFADEVNGKKSKLKIIIHNGRTHQIRVHLKSIGFPIIGDELYGGKRYNRVMLHAKRVKLLDYDFFVEEPKEFKHFSS